MRNALTWAVLIVLLVHARSLGGEFLVYDDGAHLANNPLFQPPTLHALVRLWSAPFEGLWAPLSYTLWWVLAKLSYALSGELDPRVFHAANWVLHGIVCALVFKLCVRRGATSSGAMLGALLFGLHPLCVESVAWVSELRGLLSAALGLGALLCLGPTPRGRWLGGVLFALALLAKPAAVAFLPIAWLLDSRPWRERSIALLPWLLLALGMTLVTRSLQTEETIRTIPGVIARAWIALDALAHYARAFAWPVHLCVDHGRTPEWVLQNPQWLGLLLGLCLWAAWWLRTGARLPLVSMAALLPVLGLLPFAFQNTSTVADRYAYLALLGPALWVSGWQSRPARTALAVLFVAWSFLSVRQQGYWLDDERLFGRALAVNARSAVAHNNLGLAALRAGDVSRAEQHWRSALELRPWDVRARANLGLCLFQRGEFDAGMGELRRSLAAEPRYLRARTNLVRGLAQRGAWSEAGSESLRLVELHPDSAEAWTLRAQVLLAQGQPGAAKAAIDRALELIPGYGPARALLVTPSPVSR